MKKIALLTIFTGQQSYGIDLSNYDEVLDETEEFPDHTEFSIGFFKEGKCVRRMIKPSCDITYD
jgi:hypothetical protein